jgi:hypothetical protein
VVAVVDEDAGAVVAVVAVVSVDEPDGSDEPVAPDEPDEPDEPDALAVASTHGAQLAAATGRRADRRAVRR